MRLLLLLLRSVILSFAILLRLCTSSIAALGDQAQPGPDEKMLFYAPSANEETQFSHIQAVITSYRIGTRYGEIDIRDGLHHPWKMLVGGDLLIEGRRIDCQEAPDPGEEPNLVICPDWPKNIVLGHTLVTLTYWMDEIGGKPIIVVSKIDRTSGPFIP